MKNRKSQMPMLLGVLGLFAVLAAGVGFGIVYGRSTTAGQGTGVSADSAVEMRQTQIILSQNGSSISGDGAHVDGKQIVITQGGVYSLKGSLEEGQIYVDADSEETVVLMLNGVDIRNDNDAAIHVENAGHTSLRLETGTENRVQSGAEINPEAMESDEEASGGAIYAKADLSITGEGGLQVYGYINNGIQTSNQLWMESGSVTVEAINNGVKGKDSVTVTGGSLTVLSIGDGIQTKNLLEISGGIFNIAVKGDGAKGLKSGGAIVVTGGSFSVDSYDDAIHSDDTITLSGGNFLLSSGDDGIHAETELRISGGTLQILKSYEGLEANQIIIEDGVIEVSASDDGINVNGSTNMWGRERGDRGHEPEEDTVTEMPNLTIYGGTIAVNAGGDGIDSNGNITIEGGMVIVDGPTDNGNGAIDFGRENDGKCVINGGTVIAVGSSGMAEGFDENSEQCSFRCYLSSAFETGSEIIIYNSDRQEIFRHTTAKTGNSVVFSCPELVQGEAYILSVAGEETEIVLNRVSTDVGQKWE